MKTHNAANVSEVIVNESRASASAGKLKDRATDPHRWEPLSIVERSSHISRDRKYVFFLFYATLVAIGIIGVAHGPWYAIAGALLAFFTVGLLILYKKL